MGQQPGATPYASQAGYRPPPTPPPRPPLPASSNVESMTTPPPTNAETGFQPGHLSSPGYARPKDWIGKFPPVDIALASPSTSGGGQTPPAPGWSGQTPNIRSRIEAPARPDEMGMRYMNIPSEEAAMEGAAQAMPLPSAKGDYIDHPTDRHINHLLENPHLAPQFDQKFGQGAAASHLNGGLGGNGPGQGSPDPRELPDPLQPSDPVPLMYRERRENPAPFKGPRPIKPGKFPKGMEREYS